MPSASYLLLAAPSTATSNSTFNLTVTAKDASGVLHVTGVKTTAGSVDGDLTLAPNATNIDAGIEDEVLGDALYREVLGVFARRIAERR